LIFLYANKNLQFNGLFCTGNIILENQKTKHPLPEIKKSLCIIIPARNEEKYISETIKSILTQNVKKFVLIVDDNSTDKTSEEALRTFKKNKFSQFKIIDALRLPEGWSGKVWALKQGVDWAAKQKFSHFLFIDSDIILKKDIVKRTLNHMNDKKLSMVSLMAKLKCQSLWEFLLIPSFIYFFQKLYPFSKVNNNRETLAAAAGGFILCKSEIFKKENIYEQIKNKIIDDCNLAKKIKSYKSNIWLGLTRMVESQRSYTKLEEVWRMVSRTAYEQLNHSILLLIVSIFGMITIYILPFINLLIQNNSDLIILNFFSILLMTISFLPTARFYNVSFLFYFSLPFSSLIYMLMTINSASNYYFKNGNIWKGRKY
jgi:hopene-associated glycosyltransferase HpnB